MAFGYDDPHDDRIEQELTHYTDNPFASANHHLHREDLTCSCDHEDRECWYCGAIEDCKFVKERCFCMSCKGSIKVDDAVKDDGSEYEEENDDDAESEEGNDDDAESDSGEGNDDDSESEEENDDDSDSEEKGNGSWALVDGSSSNEDGNGSLDEGSGEDVAAAPQSEEGRSFSSLFEEPVDEDAGSEREVDPESEGSREEDLADNVSDEDDGTNGHRSDGQESDDDERDSSRNDNHDNGNLQVEDNNQDDDIEGSSSPSGPDASFGLPSPKSAHHDAASDSGKAHSTRGDSFDLDDPDTAFAERERALYLLKNLSSSCSS